MKCFVQYDPSTGDIIAVVGGERTPNHAHQIEFAQYQDVTGMKVDILNGVLVPAPIDAGGIDLGMTSAGAEEPLHGELV